MITGVLIGSYLTAAYIAGFHMFQVQQGDKLGIAAFVFSPITVPISIGSLVVYVIASTLSE